MFLIARIVAATVNIAYTDQRTCNLLGCFPIGYRAYGGLHKAAFMQLDPYNLGL